MRLREADGGSKPCQSRPIMWTVPDLDERMPQRDPYQLGFLTCTGWRGDAQPTRYHVLEHLAIDTTP